jgi:ADP-ribose pyrophosphatase YjhB (NUDIX family)
VCEIDGIQHVLLGERKSDEVGHDKKWVTFGGKSEFKQDKTLAQTAYRELYEETLGMINLEKEFQEAPFHDLVRPEYQFRQFFVRLPVCTDVQEMKRARVPPSLRHNHHTGDLEYHRFKWFPISVVRNTSAKGEIGNTEYTAYHAFALNLQVPHMQWVLQQLEEKREINEHRHVQTAPGIAGTPSTEARSAPVYADFEQLRP